MDLHIISNSAEMRRIHYVFVELWDQLSRTYQKPTKWARESGSSWYREMSRPTLGSKDILKRTALPVIYYSTFEL
jgi:hypothetical protein